MAQVASKLHAIDLSGITSLGSTSQEKINHEAKSLAASAAICSIGKPGPFQIIDTDSCSADAPIAAPRRRYSCPNYEGCLNLAVALDWDNFTCRGCSGEIDEALNWRAHQAIRKDRLVQALCEFPGVGAPATSQGNSANCASTEALSSNSISEEHPIPLIETGIIETTIGPDVIIRPGALPSLSLRSINTASCEEQSREEDIYFELYEQMQGSGSKVNGDALKAISASSTLSDVHTTNTSTTSTRLLKMAGR